ncbi:L domain-like protein [Dioscorea alata]|uniref:L domain-like protein n=1 Tax=Dioscorea alata TaxID=55571 RepID=A0ACB7WMF6_DIOAL|nr:L domain-like protein [Dioscorea alata]
MPSSVTTQIHNCFPCLDYLYIQECDEVNGLQWPISFQLPQCLYGLSSLTRLVLISTKIKNFPTEVMATLHALDGLDLQECNELSSVEGLHCLPSLKRLSIRQCPKFHSLPEGGFPSSLETLEIIECDLGLMERCQQEQSLEWLMIQHIPNQRYF